MASESEVAAAASGGRTDKGACLYAVRQTHATTVSTVAPMSPSRLMQSGIKMTLARRRHAEQPNDGRKKLSAHERL